MIANKFKVSPKMNKIKYHNLKNYFITKKTNNKGKPNVVLRQKNWYTSRFNVELDRYDMTTDNTS